MAEALSLEIVTPERLLVREEVTAVQVPAANGYLGILPGHAPLRPPHRPCQSIVSGPSDSPERNWRMNGLSELSMSSAGPASTILPLHSTLM